ncbi:MAG: alpha/beta hydrolase [Spirochaetaceae bacterium]|nr:alpha/beta hydrolase [Spirochaetaceae bacterium]
MKSTLTSPDAAGMSPWPGLEPHGTRAFPVRGALEIFYFDSSRRGSPERPEIADQAPSGAGGPGRPGSPAEGSGKPALVLIHGLGDEADTWRHLFPLLSRDFRLVAPDLPGFGRSLPGDPAGFDSGIIAAADLVLDTMDAAGLGEAILVGSSLGAVVAELVAFRAPGRVRGLVLLDGGLPSPRSLPAALVPLVLPFLGPAAYRSLRGKPEAAYESLRPFYRDLDALDAADRDFLARRVAARVDSERQLRGFFGLLRSAAFAALFGQGLFRRGLAALDKPVLVLWGSEDRFADRRAAARIARHAKRCSFSEIEGAGHLPQQERPEALAAAIASFAGACPRA